MLITTSQAKKNKTSNNHSTCPTQCFDTYATERTSSLYLSKPVTPVPTQPPTLSGTGNKYQPKCGHALQLGSKGRYGSFHLWINMWVAGKTVWFIVNTCHTWAL